MDDCCLGTFSQVIGYAGRLAYLITFAVKFTPSRGWCCVLVLPSPGYHQRPINLLAVLFMNLVQ